METLSLDSQPLADLLARVSRGDGPALRRLYEAAAPRLYAVALRVLGDARDAGEVVEQSVLMVWRHADQFDPAGEPMGWLASLARDRAIRRRRARQAWLPDDSPVEIASGEVLPTVFLEGLTYLELAPRLAAGVGPAKRCVRRELVALGAPDVAEEDAFLAAEYALGVLDAEQRKAANARMLTDLALAEAVRGWSARFEPWFETLAPQRPPGALWTRIERRLQAAEPAPPTVTAPVGYAAPRRSLRGWLLVAAAAVTLCVVGAGVWFAIHAAPPSAGGGAAEPMLAGRLMPPKGDPLFLATLDTARGEIVVVQSREVLTGGQTLRLWLMDGEGKPHAVGELPPTASTTRLKLPRGVAEDARAGGEVVVSLEPAGAAGEAPSGLTIASGPLAPA